MDFNPRAPCGARRLEPEDIHRALNISIHAPLAGRDYDMDGNDQPIEISIHAPLAGRDDYGLPGICRGAISIHAPLAGRDEYKRFSKAAGLHFNPRAPCGARPLPAAQRVRY